MKIYNDLINNNASLSVIGLGYVGMPIAVEFAKHINVIGFDTNSNKIQKYKDGIDATFEVGNEAIKNTTMEFTDNPARIKDARFHIVAVPTPINQDKTPDLTPVISATKLLSENLTKGSIIVYESTVYPGVTEDICIPLIEETSGLKHGDDFIVGYSPERINPGDKVNTLRTIVKIVSASDNSYLDEIAKVYEIVVEAGTHKASSIKVAEAAKVIENSQRDINIAFMNEIAHVFDKMDIDSQDVIDAMNTKWNSLGFTPGLVGGHCIGVDPYYFIYEAEKLGYSSQLISLGRKINDHMGDFIADKIIEKIFVSDKKPSETKVVLLGLTFKEHTPDTRNTRVVDIISRLADYNINPDVVDPWADKEEAKEFYNLDIKDISEINDADVIVLSTNHDEFKHLGIKQIDSLFKDNLNNNQKIIIDIKSTFNKNELIKNGYSYWRL